jgi:hypothetical protein
MNFTEKDRLNKIKQPQKAIKADITKKKLSILEMRRYIKERKKLYDDLINKENELSTNKEEIANKIVRDRFLQYQD